MASAHSQATHGRAIKTDEPAQALSARRGAGARNELVGELARYLGAISILVVGVIHAQQYYDAYFSFVPTIGTLFLLSFVGSGVVGVTLIAPVRRLGRSIGDLILVLAALGAIGIALGSLASLLISEYRPLFGFMESGYRLAIVLTLVFDSLATLFLGVFILIVARGRHHHRARSVHPARVRTSR